MRKLFEEPSYYPAIYAWVSPAVSSPRVSPPAPCTLLSLPAYGPSTPLPSTKISCVTQEHKLHSKYIMCFVITNCHITGTAHVTFFLLLRQSSVTLSVGGRSPPPSVKALFYELLYEIWHLLRVCFCTAKNFVLGSSVLLIRIAFREEQQRAFTIRSFPSSLKQKK